MMYKKGVAVELQFSAQRLQTPSAGPYALGLTQAEAHALYEGLTVRLAASSTAAPMIVTLEKPGSTAAHVSTDAVADAHASSETTTDLSATGAANVAIAYATAPGAHTAAARGANTAAATIVVESAAVDADFKQWVCVICGWVYDEAAGLPEEGIAPGTRFEDIDDEWRCPLCDVGKEDFVVVEF